MTGLVDTAKERELDFLGHIIDAAAAPSLGLVNRMMGMTHCRFGAHQRRSTKLQTDNLDHGKIDGTLEAEPGQP